MTPLFYFAKIALEKMRERKTPWAKWPAAKHLWMLLLFYTLTSSMATIGAQKLKCSTTWLHRLTSKPHARSLRAPHVFRMSLLHVSSLRFWRKRVAPCPQKKWPMKCAIARPRKRLSRLLKLPKNGARLSASRLKIACSIAWTPIFLSRLNGKKNPPQGGLFFLTAKVSFS